MKRMTHFQFMKFCLIIFFLIIFSSSVFAAYWTTPNDIQIACRNQAYSSDSSTMTTMSYNKYSCLSGYSACYDYGVYYLSGREIWIWCDDNVQFACSTVKNCGNVKYENRLSPTYLCEAVGAGYDANCVIPSVQSSKRLVDCNYAAANTACTNGFCNGAGYCAVPKAAFTYTNSPPGRIANSGYVLLDASSSTDPDGSISTYRWQFMDGTLSRDYTWSSPTYLHYFSVSDGTYNIPVTLTVTDSNNNQNTVIQTITLIKECASSCCVPKTCAQMGWACGSGTETACGSYIDCAMTGCPIPTSNYGCSNHQCVPTCKATCAGYNSGFCSATNWYERNPEAQPGYCYSNFYKYANNAYCIGQNPSIPDCWCFNYELSCTSPEQCISPTTGCCTPQCTGKQCGDNGCGGSCGTCPDGYSCSSSQQCIKNCAKTCTDSGYTAGSCYLASTNWLNSNPFSQNGFCYFGWNENANNQYCIDADSSKPDCWCYFSAACTGSQQCISPTTGCCTPSCTGKTCGTNGCGGTCGSCVSPAVCDATGNCCTPNCAGKTCGSDGCGGTCSPGCTLPSTCDANGQCTQDCQQKCTSSGYEDGGCKNDPVYSEGGNTCAGTNTCNFQIHEVTGTTCASGYKCWCFNKDLSCSDIANCPAYCTSTGCCKANGNSCSLSSECCSGRCSNGFCCSSGTCCATSNNCALNQYCTSSFNCVNCPANACGATAVNGGTSCSAVLPKQYGIYNTNNHCTLTCLNEVDAATACGCNNKVYIAASFQDHVKALVQQAVNANAVPSYVISENYCCPNADDCVFNHACYTKGSKYNVDSDSAGTKEICN